MAGSAGQRSGAPGSNDRLTIIRCGQVLAPDALGARDVVIAGGRIVAVADPGVEITGLEVAVLDLRALTVAPGFIDNHMHVLGGGGGLGFASRAPELQTSQLTRAGRAREPGLRPGPLDQAPVRSAPAAINPLSG